MLLSTPLCHLITVVSNVLAGTVTLTIKVDPTETGQLQLFGTRDPFQNALLADPGGTVNVRGPILTDGGLYHIQINIFGIDNDRNIFLP
ncbi:MAG TPA: hypothetical protein VE548_10485, partial [Nitrososphaeraceae archaeon]|nr:hypothetical protein [Nitrososphaeraceae archaeon]